MSATDNNLLVRRYIGEIVNARNEETLAEFISPEYIEVFEGKTYPDLHLTIEQQIAEDDCVLTSYVARGTHQGEWMGMAPTEMPLEFYGVTIDHIVNGRIVEHGEAATISACAADAIRAAGRTDASLKWPLLL
jgi:predicted ester cyclase